MAGKKTKKWIIIAVITVIVIAGINFVLPLFQPPGLPQGFASGNGRTEATEVDITTKFGGRLAAVLVKEGENVEVNQILAQFDTKEAHYLLFEFHPLLPDTIGMILTMVYSSTPKGISD